jgi:hypothetical protein
MRRWRLFPHAQPTSHAPHKLDQRRETHARHERHEVQQRDANEKENADELRCRRLTELSFAGTVFVKVRVVGLLAAQVAKAHAAILALDEIATSGFDN